MNLTGIVATVKASRPVLVVSSHPAGENLPPYRPWLPPPRRLYQHRR